MERDSISRSREGWRGLSVVGGWCRLKKKCESFLEKKKMFVYIKKWILV